MILTSERFCALDLPIRRKSRLNLFRMKRPLKNRLIIEPHLLSSLEDLPGEDDAPETGAGTRSPGFRSRRLVLALEPRVNQGG